jgi:hypothetical protein
MKHGEKIEVVPASGMPVMDDGTDYALYLAVNDAEMTADVPAKREDALKMMLADHLDIQRWASLRYWHIGKIIHTLQERGEKQIYEDASRITQYQKRQLQYCVLVYQKLTYDTLKKISSRLEWTQVKDILRLRSETDRKKLCENVVVGKLEKKDITPAVEKLLEKEKQESSKERAPKVAKAKEEPAVNPPAVFAAFTHSIQTLLKQLRSKDAEIKQVVAYMCDSKRVSQEQYEEWKVHADKAKEAADNLRMHLFEQIQFLQNECN